MNLVVEFGVSLYLMILYDFFWVALFFLNCRLRVKEVQQMGDVLKVWLLFSGPYWWRHFEFGDRPSSW